MIFKFACYFCLFVLLEECDLDVYYSRYLVLDGVSFFIEARCVLSWSSWRFDWYLYLYLPATTTKHKRYAHIFIDYTSI